MGPPWWLLITMMVMMMMMMMMMMIFIQRRPQLLSYIVLITVTSPRDHLKHKVIPAEGCHGKEVVGREE